MRGKLRARSNWYRKRVNKVTPVQIRSASRARSGQAEPPTPPLFSSRFGGTQSWVGDDSQGLVKTYLPDVLPELFPMNPAEDGFRLVVRQTDLARPEALLKVTVFGHELIAMERLSRRSQRQENHGAEHVSELSHQIKSCSLAVVRRRAEILLKVDPALRGPLKKYAVLADNACPTTKS
jgi:hypothetical protein